MPYTELRTSWQVPLDWDGFCLGLHPWPWESSVHVYYFKKFVPNIHWYAREQFSLCGKKMKIHKINSPPTGNLKSSGKPTTINCQLSRSIRISLWLGLVMEVYADNCFKGAQWREWCILTGKLGERTNSFWSSLIGVRWILLSEDVVCGLCSRQKKD